MKIKNFDIKFISALIMLMTLISQPIYSAVSLNPKGVGQVLIYPYYTVNNGMNTLISLVNSSDNTKAVKIKFMEGKNNRDTLIFNIYLPPHDEWTAALVSSGSTLPDFEGQNSVKLITFDETCTTPSAINGQEFLPYAFNGASDDIFENNLSRSREGQIQVFDLGNVVGDYADEVANDCLAINNHWAANGAWTNNPKTNMEASDARGGLYGSVSIIDVSSGFNVSYNAKAIQGFSDTILHEFPGTSQPDLNSATTTTSNNSFDGGNFYSIVWQYPFQAVSSLFMTESIYSEFIMGNGIGANTEMVISFPTKQFYTDPLFAPDTTPIEPFTQTINNSGNCEQSDITEFDRESNANSSISTVNLCWGVNILQYSQNSNNKEASTILGSNNTINIVSQFDKGWTNFIFNQSSATTDPNQPFSNFYTLHGLPFIGFSIQRYIANNVGDGLLANYAGIFDFKGTSTVSVAIP